MPRLTKRAISIRECEELAEHRVRKAFIRLCFDEEDSLQDDIDQIILADLAEGLKVLFTRSIQAME